VSIFAAVVEAGSFVRAAEVLGLTPSGVSRAVSRLEDRVGIRLLDRTTKSMRLTDEGAHFYDEASRHLEGIGEAAARAAGSAVAVGGRLRVNIHPYFSRLVLAPKLPLLIDRYPDLQLELLSKEDNGDLVGDGVDVALRFGPRRSSSMISRLLLETRVLTVAAPTYLRTRGTPKRPTDLERHSCINFRDPSTGRPFEWELHRGREIVPVEAKGPLLLTDVATMLEACLAGAGIAQVLALGVGDLLTSGRLVDLFPDWPGETFPLYALYPSRHHPPAKVRAFLDFCIEITR
jgi:DNA-binding transcriptional LysR family regulator